MSQQFQPPLESPAAAAAVANPFQQANGFQLQPQQAQQPFVFGQAASSPTPGVNLTQLESAYQVAFVSGAGAERQAAFQYLAEYQKTHAAWTISQSFFSPSMSRNMQFFGATVIYNKVLAAMSKPEGEEGRLSSTEQMQLIEQLFAVLQENSLRSKKLKLQRRTITKIAESMATMAIELPDCAKNLLNLMLMRVQEAASAQPKIESLLHHPTTEVFMLLLNAMVEEVFEQEECDNDNDGDDDDPGGDSIEQLKSVFEQAAPTLRHMFQLLLNEICTKWAAKPFPSQSLVDATRQVVSCLQCRSISGSMPILQEHGVWPLVCQLYLLTMQHVDVTEGEPDGVEEPANTTDIPAAICAVFVSAMNERGIQAQRSQARETACETMRQLIAALEPEYRRLDEIACRRRLDLEQSEDAEMVESLLQSIATVTSLFAERETEWLCADRSQLASTDNPTPNRPFIAFFDFVLHMSHHPYSREILKTSLEVWGAMFASVRPEHRVHLRQDYFHHALNAVLTEFTYPQCFVSWLPQRMTDDQWDINSSYFMVNYYESNDDWNEQREMCPDQLRFILDALGGATFVNELVNRIIAPASPSEATWQKIEGLLVVLCTMSGELELFFKDDEPDTRPSEAEKEATANRFQQLFATIFKWLGVGLKAGETPVASPPLNPLLVAACCAVVENFSWLPEHLPAANQTAIVTCAVEFLLAAIPLTQIHAKYKSRHRSNGHWLKSESNLGPLDGCDMAGHAFRELCRTDAVMRIMMATPQLLNDVLKRILHTSGFSEHVSTSMRKLWLAGLSSILLHMAYSDSPQVLLQPGCQRMDQARVMLEQLLSVPMSRLTDRLNAVRTFHAEAKPNFGGNREQMQAWQKQRTAQFNELQGEVTAELRTIHGILHPLAYIPNSKPDLQKKAEDLVGFILQADAYARQHGQPSPEPARSLAFGIFQAFQPIAAQLVGLFRKRGANPDPLATMITIQQALITIVYPNELCPNALLPPVPLTDEQMLQRIQHGAPVTAAKLQPTPLQVILEQALSVYMVMPLPAALQLFERAVSRHQWGLRPELRDMWCSLIGQNSTSIPDLDDRFFILCAALYEHAPRPFVRNPSNTLGQILNYAVTVLDPKNSYWSKQCIIFLRVILQNLDPYQKLTDPDERKATREAFRDCFKLYGEAICDRIMENHDPALRHTDHSAMRAVIRACAQRYPKGIKKWMPAKWITFILRTDKKELEDDEELQPEEDAQEQNGME